MNLLSEVVILIGGFVILVYFFFKRKYSYWAKLGVPYAEPSFPWGNIGQHHKCSLWTDLIQRILVKDFEYFHDRARYYNTEDDPISAHLFNIDGEKWKTLRAKISPTFTSGKMKMILPTMIDVAQNFHKTLFEKIGNDTEIEIKEYLSRFSTDVIGSCAFGLDCNSLKNPNVEFRIYGDKSIQMSWWKNLKLYFAESYKDLALKLHITIVDKDVSDFYRGVVSETIKYREENGVQRNDFLNLLMQIKNHGNIDSETSNNEGKLTLEEIAAQSFAFFVAGYETSATAMAFALYELAKHPEIQAKTRKNVVETLAKYNGEFTYEAAMEMTYLDQAINEVMRKYPSGGSLTRRISRDYHVPGTKFVLKKNLRVIIPIHAIQNDPDIFPDPDKFDPDRFSVESSKNRHSAAFMPFGYGSRNCIGLRFGMMQMRVGLATILRSFHINSCSRTPNPIILKKDNIMMAPQGGFCSRYRGSSTCQDHWTALAELSEIFQV
ncbi:cytochrome P450 6a9-like [Phlebotomus papatasi]|uniref:cytochrome P450 6a9-like n=1 Tax=Phlebotomus papatasi TaxID=29031 RepID=UPI0024837F60|nr:cytochrome P450 6a9-like [Phlebotomus papatasi]